MNKHIENKANAKAYKLGRGRLYEDDKSATWIQSV